MGEDLSILLTAQLNEKASKKTLDKQIKDLSKNIEKLQLNINIDQKILKALTDFSKSMKQVGEIFKQQNDITKKNITITQELDGATKKVEQTIKSNGKVLETITTKYKKQTEESKKAVEAINQETSAYGKLAVEKNKYAGSTYIGSSNTYTTGKYTKTTVNTDANGDELNHAITISHEKKMDIIHKEALEMNKAYDASVKAFAEAEQRKRNELKKTAEESAKLTNKDLKDKYNNMLNEAYEMNKAYDAEKRRSFNLGDRQAISSFTGTSRTDAEKYAKEIYGAKAAVTGFNQTMDKNGKIIAEATVRVNKNSKEYVEYKMKVDQATKSVHQFGDAISKKTGKDMGVFEQFKVAMERFPVWIASATLFMGTLHQLQNSVKYIVDMNTAMVELNKVVDLSSDKLNNMRDSAISLGKELGHSSVDIMNSMAEFGRVTKNPAEIVELTKVATMASNVTSLTAEEAAKSLNTTMISFKMNAMDSMKVLSQWNEIQNNFRTSAEDLSDSIGKVGSAAKQANVDITELEGMTTAIVSSTGISGSEAGTAIKGILARLYRVGDSEDGIAEAGKTEEFLNNMGIAVRKSATEFRSMGDILGDIQKRWSTMSTTEKSALSQQIAGVYHYSKFIGLMDNYQISIDATNKALNSNGSATKENEKYLDSITGKTELFKVALEDLYGTIISSNGLKNLVEHATEFVNVIERIIKYLGGWNIALTGAIVASIAFSKALMSVNVQLAEQGVLSFGNAIKALIPSFFGATAATGALNTQLTVMNALAGAIPLVIGAIVIATMKWANSKQKAAEEQAKLKKEQEDALNTRVESIKTLKQEVDNTDKLANEYDTLKNKTNLTKEESARLKTVQEELAKIYPSVADGIDNENRLYTTNIDKVRTLTSEKKELLKQQLLNAKTELELQKGQLESNVKSLENEALVKQYSINENDAAYNQILNQTPEQYKARHGVDLPSKAALEADAKIFKEMALASGKEREKILTDLANDKQKLQQLAEIDKSLEQIDNPIIPKKENPDGYISPKGDKNTNTFKAEGVEVENLTDALIASANAHSKLTQAESDHIERQIKIADKAKDYNKELELQNQLIDSQTAKIKDLDTANDKIGDIISDVKTSDAERSKSMGQKAYDISGWFTADGGSSGAYEQIVAKLQQKTKAIEARGGDEHQKQNEIDVIKNEIAYIKDLFDTVSKLKKAYSDNEQEVINIQDKIDATQADIVIKKIEIASRNSERAMVPLNNEMDKLNNREKNLEENDYQGHVDVINSKIRVQEKITQEYDKALKDLANSTDAAGRNTKEYGDKYRELLKAKKDSIQLTEEEKRVQLDYLKERDKALVDAEKQKSYDALESLHKAKLQEIEQSLYGQEEDAQYKWEEANKTQIEVLQTQLDLMKQKNDEASLEEERQQKLLDIEKQKQKIANIESEKNVRLYQNGQWSWVSDPRKLREENSTLQDMETSFTQWETENNQKHNEEKLQNQIDNLSKMSDEKQKVYDKMAKIEDDSYKKSEDKLNETYKNMDQVYQIHWNNVYETAKGKIDEIEKYETSAADRIKANLLAATQVVYNPSVTTNNNTSSNNNSQTKTIPVNSTPSVVQVQSNGKAPSGLSVGTIVQTAGGNYQITSVKSDGSYVSKKINSYDTGGYTGDGEGLAYLHPKELILNKADTFNILKVVETVKDIMSNVKLPSFSVPQLALTGSTGQSVTNYNSVNVGGVKTNDSRSFLNNLLRQVNK